MIVVATTLAAFAMDRRDTYAAWLYTAEEVIASHDDVRFFAAVQVDTRGTAPFVPLLEELADLPVHVDYWSYSLDDGRTEVTTLNRQRHLTMGENLCSDYATGEGASHLLFCAADCAPPGDVLPKLVEVDAPVAAAHVSTYCLDGDRDAGYAFPHHAGPFTAACVLLRRDAFKQLKWRYDPDLGMTDDPAMAFDVLHKFGQHPITRRDCLAQHYPMSIGAIETRGHDMQVHR